MENKVRKELRSKKMMADFIDSMPSRYGDEKATRIYNDMVSRLISMYEDHKNDNKRKKMHTYYAILPMAAFYLSLCQVDDPKNAYKISRDIYLGEAEKRAKMMRTMMKIPGFHKVSLKMMAKMTRSTFGEAAGSSLAS